MERNISLFGESEASLRTQKPPKWRLVTNQRNLLYMMAAGLIMSPKAYGEKYYRDALSSFPGWIPLFADNVPQAAIELSISEKRHLIPCIATIDLKALHGRMVVLDNGGRSREIRFPDELNGNEAALLTPTPLPVTWIESIAFPSKEDRSNCEADARDFGNVPLLDFKREVAGALFSKAAKSTWPPVEVTLPNRDFPLDKPFAAGGMMAMLLHMGNLGDLGIQASRLGFDPSASDAQFIPDPMISGLGAWMEAGKSVELNDILSKLFWGAVDGVMTCRSAVDGMNPIDVILGYLETAGKDLDERMKQALSRLASDLRELTGFADSTITELFERHPKPFSRVMTLFFLREKCQDLIEFRHPLLTEVDYIAAAILFAARDGWLGLPLNLREVDGLPAAVSHRMAALAHRMTGSDIDLGAPPVRPMPLRELFAPGPKGWTAKQRDAALLLARESKWGDCLQTRINLGKGDYRMLIDGSGVQILLPGDVRAVVTEVKSLQFFKLIGKTAISPKTEKNVRNSFKA